MEYWSVGLLDCLTSLRHSIFYYLKKPSRYFGMAFYIGEEAPGNCKFGITREFPLFYCIHYTIRCNLLL